MARRCHCDTLFRRLEEDVRLRTLPMAAQMLWLRLMRLAASTPGFDGVLRFGSEFGFLVSVSLAVSCAETELGTNLETLERRGLVQRGEDGQSLLLPEVDAADGRARAARINGLKGGRRRKDDTPETYAARRQGSLMLPLAGGAAETQETETEPNRESSRAAAKPIAIEAKPAAVREESDWVALGMELGEIAGLDTVRDRWTCQDVKGWLDAGASPDLIRDVVRTVAARPRPDGRPIGSLKFFTGAVLQALDRAAPPPPPVQRSTSGYAAEFQRWKENGAHGAPPRLAEWRASQAVA